MNEHERIVEEYLVYSWPDVIKEEYWFGKQPGDLNEAIVRACISERPSPIHGRLVKHSHQLSIPPKSLAQCSDSLAARAHDLQQSVDFEQLHERIGTHIGKFERIGVLTIYDISLRIGWFLDLRPTVVYLHAGTRKGAEALIAGVAGARLDLSKLPKAFQKLTPAQAEDVLCRYKDEFSNPGSFEPGVRTGACAPSAKKIHRNC